MLMENVERHSRLMFCRDVDRGASSEADLRPDHRLVVVVVDPTSAMLEVRLCPACLQNVLEFSVGSFASSNA